MRKKHRSLEDNDRLEAFKRLIGTQCEPAIFYTVDEPEPLLLRNKGLLRKDVSHLREMCLIAGGQVHNDERQPYRHAGGFPTPRFDYRRMNDILNEFENVRTESNLRKI